MERILDYQITNEIYDALLARNQEKPDRKGRVLPVRALDFLYLKRYSHALLAQIKRTPDGLLLNGERIRVTQPLQPGDRLRVHVPQQPISFYPAEPAQLPQILYEDADLLVIDKCAHMPVHPSAGHREDTLANAVTWMYSRSGTPFSFHCINRLDADTTGAVLLARNALSAAILSEDMKQRRISRIYEGIVRGHLKDAGTIDAPIARQEGSVILREVDEHRGERAVTHYTPLRYLKEHDLTCVSFRLETGRTHQIRVHTAWLGYPLLGDGLYGPDREQEGSGLHLINRQALHARSLTFTHPVTEETLCIEAPLPADMLAVLQSE